MTSGPDKVDCSWRLARTTATENDVSPESEVVSRLVDGMVPSSSGPSSSSIPRLRAFLGADLFVRCLFRHDCRERADVVPSFPWCRRQMYRGVYLTKLEGTVPSDGSAPSSVSIQFSIVNIVVVRTTGLVEGGDTGSIEKANGEVVEA